MSFSRKLGNILEETWWKHFWHNKIVRTSIWLDNIFWSCDVICNDCSKTNIFPCLLKIGPSKFLQVVLKLFFSGVSEDRYHVLSYQVLHGMINVFLGFFDIEGKRGKREKKKETPPVYFDCLCDIVEEQGAKAEPLCWFVLARKSSREGADQTGAKAAKSGCEPHLTLAAHSDNMLKKWFYLWCIQILNNEIIFRGHAVSQFRAGIMLSFLNCTPLNLFWSHWFYLFIYLLLGISQQFAL